MVVHIYNEILLGNKKNEILPFVTAWMDLEVTMLHEIETGKDKNPMTALICGI